MIIGILSDIHDNLENLRRALQQLAAADALIFCGDFCSPFVVPALGEGFGKPIHAVFGNNDGDRFRIAKNAAAHAHIHLHGEFAELALDGRRIAVNHFNDIGAALARADFDLVCYGHNHAFEIARNNGALAVNPGEIYGGLTGRATCARYDTRTHEAVRVDLA